MIARSGNGRSAGHDGMHPAAAWLRAHVDASAQLSIDSRAIEAGDVFLAYRGARFDARRYIPDAIARQAAAVIWDDDGAREADGDAFVWHADWTIAALMQPDLKDECGRIAADWYGRPSESLWSVGITGTSGKTSSALWLAQAFAALGKRCAVVGTLGVGFPGALAETGLTTPDAVLLQRSLRELVDAGAEVLAIEVSSVGLVEGRLNGMRFDVALFTNLSHDHLDYHGSMAEYEAGKARLLRWDGLSAAVVNLDDAAGARMAAIARANGVRVIGFSANGSDGADLRANKLICDGDGMRFDVALDRGGESVSLSFETPLIGAYNVSNLLGVLGVLVASDIPVDHALAAMRDLKPVPGRLERIGGPAGRALPLVLVDYAHKPDALEKALSACRPLAEARGGRLIVVFGCGGDRDVAKRPLMGAIAERLADAVVLTSDNPRSEQPEAIAAAIAQGFGDPSRATIELDRALAIRHAVRAARPQDVVVIAGKGHENYQEIAGRKHPFADAEVAAAALRDLAEAGSDASELPR